MDPASVTARRERAVLAGLARFCDDEGVEVDDIANALLVEAFCAKGLAGRATSTQGTYRSVLRQLAAKPQRFSPSVPHAGAPASAPYTGAERAELWSMARHQRSGWRRHSALVVLALGLGAGMRPGEIIAARSEDLLGGRGRIAVAVRDDPDRIVAVHGAAAIVLGRLFAEGGSGHLFHPGEADRTYPNFVNDFCRNLVTDPGAPRLSSLRCRSSFICDQLGSGATLAALLEQSGITDVESLLRYARLVEGAPRSKALLRRRLKEEQDR